jgi:hypothetical protein
MPCCGPQIDRPNFRRGLQGLGAADRSQYDLAGNLLATANANLKADEASYAANSSAYSSDTGHQLIALRNRYTTLLQAYIYAYSAAWGGAPNTTGLEYGGLGQWQVYAVSGVAIGVIVAGLYEWNQHENNLRLQMQAELTQAQTGQAAQAQASALQDQAAKAYASGDTAAGDALSAMAKQQIGVAQASVTPQASQSFPDWIKSNLGWVAAGVAGVFLARELL